MELHMFVGTIRAGKSLGGYVAKGLVDTRKIKSRHDELAAELVRRKELKTGKKQTHKSKLNYIDRLAIGRVDPNVSLKELSRRCANCRKLIRGK